jgi:predicted O-methyltransferase YrrM
MDSNDQSLERILNELASFVSKEEHMDDLAQSLPKLLSPIVNSAIHRKYFRLWEEYGFHLTPVNFYQPIPDTRELKNDLWETDLHMVGVDLNEEVQLSFLKEIFPRFRSEYNSFSTFNMDVAHEFYLNNGRFDGTDALVLYCMIRHFRPNIIIEVGSGFSSRISAQAAIKNGYTKLICIEPHPDDILRSGFPGLTSLIVKKVQEVEVDYFNVLNAGDILFIDSSHVVKIGSDVNYLLLEVIPKLKPGVIIHVHDIFFPREYRRDWVMEEFRFWNEQYLLQAFLVFNSDFEVLLCNSYLGHKHQSELQATFPNSPWWGGGSFWMRRKSSKE